MILLPFPWESHGTHGIPVFPIPMHTSTLDCYAVENVHTAYRAPRGLSATVEVLMTTHYAVNKRQLSHRLITMQRWSVYNIRGDEERIDSELTLL